MAKKVEGYIKLQIPATTTLFPCFNNFSTTVEPIKPAPPVIKNSFIFNISTINFFILILIVPNNVPIYNPILMD